MTSKLNGKQDQVITLLLAGKTQKDAAAEVDVAEETVSRWMKGDAVFVATLNARRRELWGANAQRLRSLAGKAIKTLEGLLESENEAMQLRAASEILKAVSLASVEPPSGRTNPDIIRLVWRDEEIMRLRGLMKAGIQVHS